MNRMKLIGMAAAFKESYQACKEGIRTFYANASKLTGSLKVAKAKGTIDAELKKTERCPLLILDEKTYICTCTN